MQDSLLSSAVDFSIITLNVIIYVSQLTLLKKRRSYRMFQLSVISWWFNQCKNDLSDICNPSKRTSFMGSLPCPCPVFTRYVSIVDTDTCIFASWKVFLIMTTAKKGFCPPLKWFAVFFRCSFLMFLSFSFLV